MLVGQNSNPSSHINNYIILMLLTVIIFTVGLCPTVFALPRAEQEDAENKNNGLREKSLGQNSIIYATQTTHCKEYIHHSMQCLCYHVRNQTVIGCHL